MTNDALIKEARDEAARVDRNESTMEGELLTLLADALTAANAREAALRKEAAEAIWQAYKEGCNDGVFNENDNTSKPGRFFCDSTARRAAQRIGGDHG